jgi:hypothetical protein
VVGVLGFVTAASMSRAQEPRRLATSDSIPLDLATALISAGGLGGDPQILVGSLPGWVSNRLYTPAGARVLGAAFIGQTAVGVMALADAPEAVIAELKRELPGRGWQIPPPQPSYGGGFRSAPAMLMSGSPTSIVPCGNQQMLTASAARHRGTSTLVLLRVAPAGQYGPCNPPQMPLGMPRTVFPTLFNPAGAPDTRMTGDCSSTLGGSSGTSTNLRTAMAAEAILSHYGKQLVDSGWKAAGDRATIVGHAWTRTDSTGSPVELSLTVTASPRDSTCRDVSMQVRTLRKP